MNMGVIEINDSLLEALHVKAAASERLRMNYDLRTTAEDSSQRMLNVMEVGTKVPIHRHLKTSESVVCLEGCLDWVLYEELPNVDIVTEMVDMITASRAYEANVTTINAAKSMAQQALNISK